MNHSADGIAQLYQCYPLVTRTYASDCAFSCALSCKEGTNHRNGNCLAWRGIWRRLDRQMYSKRNVSEHLSGLFTAGSKFVLDYRVRGSLFELVDFPSFQFANLSTNFYISSLDWSHQEAEPKFWVSQSPLKFWINFFKNKPCTLIFQPKEKKEQ